MESNPEEEAVPEPTGDEIPDGTQLPVYHEAVAEAGEWAGREQGDAGLGNVELPQVDEGDF